MQIFPLRFRSIALVVSFVALLALPVYGFFPGLGFTKKKKEVDLEMFREVMEIVKSNYVTEVDESSLVQKAIDGMLVSLDPNSRFLDKASYSEMQMTTDGEFGGIGAELMANEGFLKVISPYYDSPAFNAGIRENDYIIKVDGQSIESMKINEGVALIRGKPDTTVKLTIFREATREIFEVEVVRQIIEINPIKAEIIDDKIMHVKVVSFSDGATKKLQATLEEARNNKKNFEGVILDFRWNPGGLLDEAYAMANLFLDSGVIVSIKGRNNGEKVVYNANGRDILEGMPMLLLINGGSASSSEIVTAALRDNKRAVVMGTKSFGKGSVQVLIPLAKDFGIKMTTALYYTPNDVAIEESKGIMPDIEVPFALLDAKPEEAKLLDISAVNDAKDEAKAAQKPDSAKLLKTNEIRDSQLLRAVDLMHGLIVQQRVLKE